jgi:hypothetical protein
MCVCVGILRLRGGGGVLCFSDTSHLRVALGWCPSFLDTHSYWSCFVLPIGLCMYGVGERCVSVIYTKVVPQVKQVNYYISPRSTPLCKIVALVPGGGGACSPLLRVTHNGSLSLSGVHLYR